MTQDGERRERLAVLGVGGGREAVIWRDGAGAVGVDAGSSVLGFGAGPYLAGVPDGTLVISRLPPTATRVQLTAPVEARETVVRAGVFMALLPERLDSRKIFLAFRDEEGALVRTPFRPAGKVLSREPVEDTDARCPACGECDWEEIETRAPVGYPFTREAVTLCCACGWHGGGRSSAGRRRPDRDRGGEPPLPDGAADEAVPEANRSPAEVVESAGFAVYGLDPDLPGRRHVSWSHSGQGTETVTIECTPLGRGAELQVTSWERGAAGWDPQRVARTTLYQGLFEWALFARTDASRAAMGLAGATAGRDARERSDRAPATERDFEVDGVPQTFTVVRDDERRWAAVALLHGVGVSLRVRGLTAADVRLVQVVDAARYLRESRGR